MFLDYFKVSINSLDKKIIYIVFLQQCCKFVISQKAVPDLFLLVGPFFKVLILFLTNNS